MTSADPQRTVEKIIVQTAKSMGPTDVWTTQPKIRFVGGSEGQGAVLGHAELVQEYGIVKLENDEAHWTTTNFGPNYGSISGVNTFVGQLVRLCHKDSTGPVALNGEYYRPFWYGVFVTEETEPNGAPTATLAGGTCRWMCEGIAGVLDKILLNRGWATSKLTDQPVDPGFLPVFNSQLSPGDRSASTYTVHGQSVYIHESGRHTPRNLWNAKQIMDLLIAGAAAPQANHIDAGSEAFYNGWTWELDDIDGALESYIPHALDLAGSSLFYAINALASPSRGMTWDITVSDTTGVCTIHVYSILQAAVSTGTETLPASSNRSSLTIAGDPWLSDLRMVVDGSSQYDVVEIVGSAPICGMTIDWTDSTAVPPTQALIGRELETSDDGGVPLYGYGWNSNQESDWGDVTVRAALTDDVYRRYEVNFAWDGRNYDGSAYLRDSLTTSGGSDPLYGYFGYTGARTAAPSALSTVPATLRRFERFVPSGFGFTRDIGGKQPPVLVYYNGGTYEDVTSLGWTLTCQDDPAAIYVDDGNGGRDIYSRISADGSKLLFTVGIKEAKPLKVSWVRNPADWPCATQRIKTIVIPNFEQWVILPHTIMGVGTAAQNSLATSVNHITVDSNPINVDGTLTIRDDVPLMRSLLGLAKSWYADLAYNVSWTDRANLDVSETYRPGTLLTSVIQGNVSTAINALIIRRTWHQVNRDGVVMWDTSYETARILPDLESRR